tara:strand:- start:954 stop:1829 length:876 start_codon:yes stop_codon:yes gene_type:complete
MNKYINCLNYLINKKTNLIQHGESNFLNHLINTYDILRSWKCNEDICFAGLFHSIYGNNSFLHRTTENREEIKNLIGEKSEKFVYDFNNNRLAYDELKLISFANELEQQNYIHIFDNLYDLQTQKDIASYFRNNVGWKYVGTGGKTSDNWRKFNYEIKSKKNKYINTLNVCAKDILKKLGIYSFFKQVRIYASAYPYGTVHEIHSDYQYKNKGITLMFYLNDEWSIEHAGETVFYDDLRYDIIKSIIPKPARAIVFDGNILHDARNSARNVADIRMVITFKYYINIEDKYK